MKRKSSDLDIGMFDQAVRYFFCVMSSNKPKASKQKPKTSKDYRDLSHEKIW